MFSSISPIVGIQQADQFFAPDTVQRHPLGMKVSIHDQYFGFQEIMYVKNAGGAAIAKPYTPVTLSWVTGTNAADAGEYRQPVVAVVAMPTAIANGTPFAVTKTAFTDAVNDTYGWVVVNGFSPVAADSALAAAAAVFAHAAGRIGATGVGKQLVGIQVVNAPTKTEVKTGQVTAASYVIRVPDTNGWFIGMPLTGTGIGASAKITAIAPDGSVTVDVVSTATGTVSVTGTYNDGTVFWPVCLLMTPESIV